MRCHGFFNLSWWDKECWASWAKSACSDAFSFSWVNDQIFACEIKPFWEKKGQTLPCLQKVCFLCIREISKFAYSNTPTSPSSLKTFGNMRMNSVNQTIRPCSQDNDYEEWIPRLWARCDSAISRKGRKKMKIRNSIELKLCHNHPTSQTLIWIGLS